MAPETPNDPVQRRLQELERRCEQLELRVSSLSQAFSRTRHRARRIWLRPPIWTFEQHSPRNLQVKQAYQAERPPADAPTFAIVTPAYNQSRYLKATIESVLSQDYPNLRYHIQDGGSDDQSLEIMRSYESRLSWRREQDAGQAQAINRGFNVVSGDIMAYLNSDDMLLPGTLAYVARAFKERPEVQLVYGHRIYVDREGLEIGRAVLPRHDAKALYWADYVPQETLFWRRSVWDKIGPLDESFQYALDWDFILRAQAAGFKFTRLPRFLACFRVHDEQKTAAIYDVGREEMQRLRVRYLKYKPTQAQIQASIARYLMRQLVVHWMYRLGLLRY